MNSASRAIRTEHDRNTLSTGHSVPPLPYDYAALEPVIGARTMRLHHGKHHASYVTKLNSALVEYPELQGQSPLWLMLNLCKVPLKLRSAIRINAGGHLNHSLFWTAMSPAGQEASAPAGALASAIDRDFGSLEQFKQRFTEEGESLFGSGWVWLVESRLGGRKLQICTSNGHDSPYQEGHFPILLNDVWEHAYYLDYQHRRSDYLRAWWTIVNWDEASRRFGLSWHSAEVRNWEDEGGTLHGATE